MDNSLFFNHVEENERNREIVNEFEEFALKNPQQQIYLITAPLGEKYDYDYEENVIVILSPKHKIIFLDLKDDENKFSEYYEDFVEDLSSISDKFEYKKHIGRPRDWKRKITIQEVFNAENSIEELFERNILPKELQRTNELLISLLIGSINDIEKIGADIPETLLA